MNLQPLFGRLGRVNQLGLAGQTVSARRPGGRLQVAGRSVLTFASADYLGLSRRPALAAAAAKALAAWGLSLGMPRSLAAADLVEHLEAALAALAGLPDALLFPSTLHAALDVIPSLSAGRATILIDTLAYPISFAGAAAAVQRGARLVQFAHNDANALEDALRRSNGPRVIICDSILPAGGEKTPLADFAALAARFDAVLYIDDAHGFGLYGRDSAAFPPYGRDGAGLPAYFRLPGSLLAGQAPRKAGGRERASLPACKLVHVASFSKALGVPIAFAAGQAGWVDHLRHSGAAAIHSSPPALPLVAAALAALQVIHTDGVQLRRKLARRVALFRRSLQARGFIPRGGEFPVQSLSYPTADAALDAAVCLRQAGVWPIVQLHPPDQPEGGVLRFAITAVHDPVDLIAAANLIGKVRTRKRVIENSVSSVQPDPVIVRFFRNRRVRMKGR